MDQLAPTTFGTKAVILTQSPNSTCVPNLKLLASMVAEISRASQNFWYASLAPTPPTLVLNVVSWYATRQTQWGVPNV